MTALLWVLAGVVWLGAVVAWVAAYPPPHPKNTRAGGRWRVACLYGLHSPTRRDGSS